MLDRENFYKNIFLLKMGGMHFHSFCNSRDWEMMPFMKCWRKAIQNWTSLSKSPEDEQNKNSGRNPPLRHMNIGWVCTMLIYSRQWSACSVVASTYQLQFSIQKGIKVSREKHHIHLCVLIQKSNPSKTTSKNSLPQLTSFPSILYTPYFILEIKFGIYYKILFISVCISFSLCMA
jgi:hypothetical protein